ncbi:hypothetical protein GCM10009017_11150 [Halarchaeum rubridurum]|nr:hypothetical protein GCM10009017_11150 [Halarchaeum rubridurum]
MRHPAPVLLVSLLVVAAVVAVPMAGATTGIDATNATPDDTANGTANDNGTIAPGERLSGVVGVQSAELGGDLEARSFGVRVARAESADAKAAVVAAQFDASETRADRLTDRLARLQQARRNESISHGQYIARVAETRAELDAVAAMANRSETVSAGLPDDVLRANGVNVTAIRSLRERAAEASGPEVAAIARTIGGPDGRAPANATERRNRTGTPAADRHPGSDGNRTATPVGGGPATAGGDRPATPASDRVENATPSAGDASGANATAVVDGERTPGEDTAATGSDGNAFGTNATPNDERASGERTTTPSDERTADSNATADTAPSTDENTTTTRGGRPADANATATSTRAAGATNGDRGR